MNLPTSVPYPEPMRAARTTLKDIAAACQLSIASVSMALRNSPNVSQVTIARVKQIAGQLRYVPDPALAALAAYRKDLHISRIATSIALVSNWSTEDGWSRQPANRQFIAGATARAAQLGYSLQRLWARDGGASPARFDQILKARGIHGLLLAPAENPGDRFNLDWNNYSVISTERPAGSVLFDFTETDQYHALSLCWSSLLALGYRRPGLIVDQTAANSWNHRWIPAQTQLQFQHETGTTRVPTLKVTGPAATEEIRTWLRTHRPDVIINCSVYTVAALATKRSILPAEVGYISLNVDEDITDATGVSPRYDAVGATAVDLLHKRLLANYRGCSEIALGTQVCGSWHEGKTLPGRLTKSRAFNVSPAELLEATAQVA